MTRALASLATVALLALNGTLSAQGTAPAESAPKLTVRSTAPVTSMATWPGLALSVNQDAYVTVFAVTRSNGSALPIQILSPTRPSVAGLVKAGKTVRPRLLRNDDAIHLLTVGESPVIVAFASAVRPELSAFNAGGRWGRDLLMDTVAGSEQQMVEILAKTIYATGVKFDAVVREPGATSAVPAVLGMRDGDEPGTSTRFGQNTGGPVPAEFDPMIRSAEFYQRSGMIPMGALNGAPFTLKGGDVVSITPAIGGGGYRLGYWPSHYSKPVPTDKTAQTGKADERTPTTPPPAK